MADLISLGSWAPGPALAALLPAAWAAAWRAAHAALADWRVFADAWRERAMDVLPTTIVISGRWGA
eukprot:982084-Pyramimonas_sp.AAC.1